MTPLLTGVLVVVGVLLGGMLGVPIARARVQKNLLSRKADADSEAQRILSSAQSEVEQIRRGAELQGKEDAYRAKEEWEREEARRREELERAESRLEERRSSLDRKYDLLVEKDRVLEQRQRELDTVEEQNKARTIEATRLESAARTKLETLAGMTAEEAAQKLIHDMEEAARSRAANTIREIKETARKEAEREAKNIIALAIQRIAADHTAESTVSVVALPSDEMKGRI